MLHPTDREIFEQEIVRGAHDSDLPSPDELLAMIRRLPADQARYISDEIYDETGILADSSIVWREE
jgi:hypothetical protein